MVLRLAHCTGWRAISEEDRNKFTKKVPCQTPWILRPVYHRVRFSVHCSTFYSRMTYQRQSTTISTNGTFFNTHCTNCGGVCCFADNSTYTISGKNTEALNATLDNSFKKIESYMSDNKLVLNSNKTHLLVMSSEAKHRKNGNFGIFLETETKVIQPQKSEQLLGGIIANNFKFNAHLKDYEKSLFRTLTSRVNALSKVCSVANFKTRVVQFDHF